jgi:hypothetical protein
LALSFVGVAALSGGASGISIFRFSGIIDVIETLSSAA